MKSMLLCKRPPYPRTYTSSTTFLSSQNRLPIVAQKFSNTSKILNQHGVKYLKNLEIIQVCLEEIDDMMPVNEASNIKNLQSEVEKANTILMAVLQKQSVEYTHIGNKMK